MSSLAIIGVFVGIGLVISLLLHNPEWQATRVLFSFRGPFPNHGETYIHFQLRRARYAAIVGLVLGGVLFLVGFSDIPSSQVASYVQIGVLFAFGIGALMAVVAFIGYVLLAIWHKLFVQSYIFDSETSFFVDAT